ncbi:MFS transporter [Azospirillum halopraeferens]|uniref:MFS transporter n=1 Tax=Azospirillum halopraeferens TaxID=34010 RepID=UPI00041B2566|nr:MFS transporter [Azospirillum halopraeferens]
MRAIALPSPFALERAATTGVFFANGLGIGAWAAAIPRLSDALALSEGRLSLVLLAFAAGAVTAMPLVGLAAARLDTGRTTAAAGLAFAAALATLPLAGGLAALCLLAFATGAANGTVDVAMNAHASGLEVRRGRPIMSSFHAAFSLGGFAGAVLGAAFAGLGDAAGLWGPALIAAAVVAAGAPHLRGGAPAPGHGTPLALPRRAMLGLCAAALACMLVEGAMADWSAVYLATVGGAGRAAAAGYAAFSLCMLAGRLTGDRLLHALGAPRVVLAGGTLAAAGLALAAAMPGPVPASIGFGLVGLGLANVVPAVFSAAARQGGPAAAGVAMAATAGYGGFLLGPPVIGLIASGAGLRTGILVLAGAAAAVAMLASSVRKTDNPPN